MDDMNNQSQQALKQPEVSTVPAPRSNMLVIVLVGLAMLGIGIGGGYILFANKNYQAPQQVIQVSPTNIQDVSPTSSTLPTNSTVQTTKLSPTKTQANGVSLANIRYTLPAGWEAKLTDTLFLTPTSDGGYLSVRVYEYNGSSGTKEYFCQVNQVNNICTNSTTYQAMNIGNIPGYMASGLDNSGGGNEYFGAKGNKFYIISSYSPPSPNEFEKNYKQVLNSLIF